MGLVQCLRAVRTCDAAAVFDQRTVRSRADTTPCCLPAAVGLEEKLVYDNKLKFKAALDSKAVRGCSALHCHRLDMPCDRQDLHWR
jgi:hypothetical protein